MLKVNHTNFQQEVLDSDKPVLIDFSAEWCGPCKMITPVLEKLAEDYDGKVKFVTVDVDESVKLAQQFHIMGVPTLLLVKDGKVVDKKVGYADQHSLAGMIEAKM